jgi:2-polyprenyl-3-methyl-5-hydroxy-6-metoxy-1,4-benzoquinol methylase
MTTLSPHCPLCQHAVTAEYAEDRFRRFFQCTQCELVFAEPSSWPTADQEKAEYDLHENALDDEGYNGFLSRIVTPLLARVPPSSDVLDFGCGPAPALARQLETAGHRVALFDTFYFPDAKVFIRDYQAIVLTEVIEHLHTPLSEITRLWARIQSGGVLAIMTQRVISQARFKTWQYKNDPTHVCFYSEETFQWLAAQLQSKSLEFAGRDMVFLTK